VPNIFFQNWTPLFANQQENRTVSGLSSETTYHFAVKVSDEIPNLSSVSNSDSAQTGSSGGGGGDIDDFNRANSTIIGNGWIEVSGDWQIVNNEVRGVGNNGIPNSAMEDPTLKKDVGHLSTFDVMATFRIDNNGNTKPVLGVNGDSTLLHSGLNAYIYLNFGSPRILLYREESAPPQSNYKPVFCNAFKAEELLKNSKYEKVAKELLNLKCNTNVLWRKQA